MKFDQVIENSQASIEKTDLKILLPILDTISPKKILEIGSWKGYSARMWYEAFNPDVLISIEKEMGVIDASWVDKTLNNQDIQFLIDADSHSPDVLKYVEKIKYDMLFIDGDHSFEGVKKDFEMYSPLVKEGGIIVLHDTNYHEDKTVEVDTFWQSIKNNYNFVEIKTSKNSIGMVVIFT